MITVDIIFPPEIRDAIAKFLLVQEIVTNRKQ